MALSHVVVSVLKLCNMMGSVWQVGNEVPLHQLILNKVSPFTIAESLFLLHLSFGGYSLSLSLSFEY